MGRQWLHESHREFVALTLDVSGPAATRVGPLVGQVRQARDNHLRGHSGPSNEESPSEMKSAIN